MSKTLISDPTKNKNVFDTFKEVVIDKPKDQSGVPMIKISDPVMKGQDPLIEKSKGISIMTSIA